MEPADLRLCRSILFLPASNPRAIEKARTLAADMVVLDLEDAVPRGGQGGGARRRRRRHPGRVRRPDGGDPGQSGGSPHYGEDVVAVRRSAADFVILAKAESAKQVTDSGWLMQKPLLAMIETPRARARRRRRSRPAAKALIAGTNDLSAELGLRHGRRPRRLRLSRCSASCSPPAPPASRVRRGLQPTGSGRGPRRRMRGGAGLGLRRQVDHPPEPDRDGPTASSARTEAELDAARRLVEAASGGAERHEGRMIEAMHVQQARALIAKARL